MPGASGASSSLATGMSFGKRPAEHALDRRARHAARPQQHRLAEAGDDGRLEADRRRPAVDDEVDAAAQIGLHVCGRRRRNMAGTVGGGRDHGLAECLEDVVGDRVVGNPDRDAVETGGCKLGDRTV